MNPLYNFLHIESMSTCKYCGKSVGLFSKAHKECEEKHSRGINGMNGLMQRYFSGSVSYVDLHMKIGRNRQPYYLSDEDIAITALSVLSSYANSLRLPYNQTILTKIKGFISSLEIPYSQLNRNGEIDRIGQKLFQGFIVDFFAKGVPMDQVQVNANSVMSVIPLNQSLVSEAYYNVLSKAADNFMKDGSISDNEQRLIESYISSLGISLTIIPPYCQNGALERIAQSLILKNLQNGIYPNVPLTVPVMLTKGEKIIWVYGNVTMLQEKITREYIGGSRGVSYRICKGLTYRTGSFKGSPVERSSMERVGTGELVITDKNFFFHCTTASFKIPYKILVGLTPYSDGLEVHKEAAKPKRIVFQGFDAWFVINVINLVTI